MKQDETQKPPPRWTFHAFRHGAWSMLPLLPGLAAFGMAFGTVTARKGLSLVDTLLMTGSVFAGMAQMIVMDNWPEHLTAAAIAGAVAIVALVNLRFLLIGATLRPWLETSPPLKVYPTLFFLTEPNWLLSMRYRGNGGSDPAFLLGSGVIIWVVWVLSAVPGYWLGSAVGDPRAFGLDLVVPAFFVAMMVTLWRGKKLAVAWAVSAATAMAADQLLGSFWYLIAGALAGGIAGGFIDD